MRIIAGSAKGRILKSPKGMLTRPTQDRIRESMFNILANVGFEGTHVLDIFAGTGALGLEALSRGAAYCVFVDHYTRQLIMQNADMCGFDDRYEVLCLDIDRALSALRGKSFQYIFADPPYNRNLVNAAVSGIGKYGLLDPDGLIVMEHSSREDIIHHPSFTVVREKSYGNDTRISFIRVSREGE